MSAASSPEPAATPAATPAAPATPAATPTPGGMTGRPSLLPDKPPPAKAAPAPATPTTPAGSDPSQPPPAYEHPWLETAFGGKYRTLADVESAQKAATGEMHKLSERAKAMEVRLGQFAGPPMDEEGKPRPYQFTPREGSPFGDIDPTAPEFEAVQRIASKYGAPEGMLQELFTEVYEPLLEGNAEGIKAVEERALIDHFGSAEALVEGLGGLQGRLEEWMGEDARDLIRRGVTTADTAILLDTLVKKLDNVTLPARGGESAGDTEADILAMRQQDPGWRNDPAKAARYSRWLEQEAARREAAGQGVGSSGGLLR